MINELLKQDLFDLAKVNVPSWLTVGWVKSQSISHMNSLIQDTGTSLLILATLVYTVFKAVNMFRHMKWAKEDRLKNRKGKP